MGTMYSYYDGQVYKNIFRQFEVRHAGLAKLNLTKGTLKKKKYVSNLF